MRRTMPLLVVSLMVSVALAQNETGTPPAGSSAPGLEKTMPPVPASESAATSTLKAEIKIGTGLENREPTGVADSFPLSTTQIVGWTRVEGAAEPTEIQHVWTFQGAESVVTLPVKSSSYRTWSRKTIGGQVGKGKLEVKDANGAVIVSKDFEITAQ